MTITLDAVNAILRLAVAAYLLVSAAACLLILVRFWRFRP